MRNKHFTFDERRKMEEYLKKGMSRNEVANSLDKSPKTIYNEFNRGKIEISENGI